MSTNLLDAQVRVILRNENQHLGRELLALTGFSLTRAMDSVEGALDPAARLRITHEVIAPLQTARVAITVASERTGSSERLVLGADVADLCRYQYQALCAALAEPGFPYDQLPHELDDPIAACARFYRAAGLPLPRRIAAVGSAQTCGERDGRSA